MRGPLIQGPTVGNLVFKDDWQYAAKQSFITSN